MKPMNFPGRKNLRRRMALEAERRMGLPSERETKHGDPQYSRRIARLESLIIPDDMALSTRTKKRREGRVTR